MRRRLLERLQQRVEGVRREHVHFVDQVDLVAAARRRVLHVVEQLARVVDLGARGRVDLEQVDEAAGVDVAAGAALAAGRRRDALLAVERLGEDARDRRLADAARAGEQERVVDAARVERVGQRAADVVLADELVEACAGATCGRGRGNSCGGRGLLGRGSRWRRPAPEYPRHPAWPLPLLPSGPGGVCGWPSRGIRREPPWRAATIAARPSGVSRDRGTARRPGPVSTGPAGGGRSARTRRSACRRADTSSRRCAASAARGTPPAARRSRACSPRGTRRGCGSSPRYSFSDLLSTSQLAGHVVDDEVREIGLPGDRAQRRELRRGEARQVQLARVRVRHALEHRLAGRRRMRRLRAELREPA